MSKLFRACRDCGQRYEVGVDGEVTEEQFTSKRCPFCKEQRVKKTQSLEENRAALAQAKGRGAVICSGNKWPDAFAEPSQWAKVRAMYNGAVERCAAATREGGAAEVAFFKGQAAGLALAFEALTGRSISQ